MSSHECITVTRSEHHIYRITLSRPEIRNAFNDTMIAELTDVFHRIQEDTSARAVVITGSGKAFCAGADLHWMKKMIDYDLEDNYRDSMALAEMLWALDDLNVPSIALVNGPAIGGGVGLITACDFALASDKAIFALAEVKLGLAPAVISPFLLRKIGDKNCRDLFLTGRQIDADEAQKIDLVNEITPHNDLEDLLTRYLNQLLSSSPTAITACKKLLRVIPHHNKREIMEFTSQVISELRISGDGQAGMQAFLKKNKPPWITRI